MSIVSEQKFFSFRYLTILSVLHKEPVNLPHIKHPLNILLLNMQLCTFNVSTLIILSKLFVLAI